MTLQEHLEVLRAIAAGDKRTITLCPTHSGVFVSKEEYLRIVKEYQVRTLSCIALEEKFTPLEQLGVRLLLENAFPNFSSTTLGNQSGGLKCKAPSR